MDFYHEEYSGKGEGCVSPCYMDWKVNSPTSSSLDRVSILTPEQDLAPSAKGLHAVDLGKNGHQRDVSNISDL